MKKIIISCFLIMLIVGAIGVGIIYFNSIKKEWEQKSLVAKFTFGKEGQGLGEFFKPAGLAIKDNYLYVADANNFRVQVLEINPNDGNLSAKSSFGKRGKGLDEFEFPGPADVAIKDNHLYVADRGNCRIQVLEINSNDGSLSAKFTFGKKGKGLSEFGEFSGPLALAIKDNYLYVADGINNRLQVLEISHDNGSLSAKFSFGKKGKGLGEFGAPTGLAIKDNYLYVADGINNRLQVLEISHDGSLSAKFSFGKKGKGLGEFGIFFGPDALAIKDDYLYVTETFTETVNFRIQVLKINPNGTLLARFTFGKWGRGLGEFYELGGLAIKENCLYVADSLNHRIQVLEIKY